MSIKRMTSVWEESKLSKSGLIALLSIADRADNDGFAWPGLADIADRARIEIETAMRAIRVAENYGELYINERKGRNHQYIVCTGQTAEEIMEGFEKRFSLTPLESILWMLFRKTNPNDVKGLTPDNFLGVEDLPLTISWGRTGLSVVTPDNLASTPLTFHSVEPLLNHQLNNHQETIKDSVPKTVQLAWSNVHGQLKMEMPKNTFDTWVKDIRVSDFKDGVIYISTKTPDIQAWMESRLNSTINRLFTGFMDQDILVEFIVDQE